MLNKISQIWVTCAVSMSLWTSPAVAMGTRVPGLYNIEDIIPISGTPWLLGSTYAGSTMPYGFLTAIDSRDGSSLRLSHRIGGVGTNCPEVAADEFEPHGLSIAAKNDQGELLLYVVNHGARESIEVFRIDMGPTPSLTWIDCKVLPEGAKGNSVAADEIGNIYVTNMGQPIDGSEPVSSRGGDVLAMAPGGNWRSVPGSRIAAPNGILLSRDGNYMYVASWIGSEIFKISLSGGHSVERLKLPELMLPDNLRWGEKDSIFSAGQLASVEAVSTCYASKRIDCYVRSGVAVIDAEKFAVRCMREVPVSIATVATPQMDNIWIGTVRGTSVLRMPTDEFSRSCKRPPQSRGYKE